MAGLSLKGEVKKVNEEVQVTDTFNKRELWMEIDQETQYPQVVSIEFIKDKCSLLDKFTKGDEVEVDINVRGNLAKMKDGTWKVYNTLNGWRIRGIAGGATDGGAADAPTGTAPGVDSGAPPDDLPF